MIYLRCTPNVVVNNLSIPRHQEELTDIVSRLTRPTMATRMRAVNFRPESQYTYVDMGAYKWNRMNLYKDYQRHVFNPNGSARAGYHRTVKAGYRSYC